MGKYIEYLKLKENLGSIAENLGSIALGVQPDTGSMLKRGNSDVDDGEEMNLPGDDEMNDEMDGEIDDELEDDADEVIVCPSCGHTFAKGEGEDDHSDDVDDVDYQDDENLDDPNSPQLSGDATVDRRLENVETEEQKLFDESIEKMCGEGWRNLLS